MFLKVKRFKHIEDLLTEANLIQTSSGEPDVDSNQLTQDQLNAISEMEKFLDSMIDKSIKVDSWRESDIVKTKQAVEFYLDYSKKRLQKITDQIKEALASGSKANKKRLKSLTAQQSQIAKRISVLDQLYGQLKSKESAQIKKVAEDISKKIEDVQRTLQESYVTLITVAAQQNQRNLSSIEKSQDPQEKEQIAEDIIDSWIVIDEITEDFNDEDKDQLARAKDYTEDKVKEQIGEDRFERFMGERPYSREELKVLERIIKLKYTDFKSEKELTTEISQIRAKINALQGQSKEDTISELSKMLDKAEIALIAKLKNKDLQLDRAKGIHFDFNKRLKLYEKVSLPVTGKQIADESAVMKFRRGLQSLMDFLLGTGSKPLTPAGEAFANFGSHIHNIYAKTLNNTAKLVGKAIKGREGEMKADALSRMFIPGTAVLDTKKEAAFEEAGSAPGMAIQVPGSIGAMGPITPPTATTLGSGDNFNPTKKKKKKKTSHILEFSDFINQNN